MRGGGVRGDQLARAVGVIEAGRSCWVGEGRAAQARDHALATSRGCNSERRGPGVWVGRAQERAASRPARPIVDDLRYMGSGGRARMTSCGAVPAAARLRALYFPRASALEIDVWRVSSSLPPSSDSHLAFSSWAVRPLVCPGPTEPTRPGSRCQPRFRSRDPHCYRGCWSVRAFAVVGRSCGVSTYRVGGARSRSGTSCLLDERNRAMSVLKTPQNATAGGRTVARDITTSSSPLPVRCRRPLSLRPGRRWSCGYLAVWSQGPCRRGERTLSSTHDVWGTGRGGEARGYFPGVVLTLRRTGIVTPHTPACARPRNLRGAL